MSRVCIIWFMILTSCIDPFNVSSLGNDQILVVEGFLTTEAKAHQISLFYSQSYGPDNIGRGSTVGAAAVLVRDDLGKTTQFEDIGNGNYRSPSNFKAEIGRSYNLEINLQNGKRYISLPEETTRLPKMDSLSFRSVRTKTTNLLNDEIGVQILAHFQDPADEVNYYYWRPLEATFVLVSEPELHRTPRWWDPTFHPNPKPCCDRCYDTEIAASSGIYSTDDFDFNGLYQSKVIAYIRDDGLRFKELYRFDAISLSISKNFQQFLSLADQQVRLTGSVFDPPPANLRGNIVSLDDRDEQVLGYFFVADVQYLRVYIPRSKLEHVVTPTVTVPKDCRDFYYNEYINWPMPNPNPLPVNPPKDWSYNK